MCEHKRIQEKTTFVGLTHFWFQMSPNIQESLDFQLFFGGKYAGQRRFTRNKSGCKKDGIMHISLCHIFNHIQIPGKKRQIMQL